MVAAEGDARLPRASTCFNTLFLPRYSSAAVLEARLAAALEGGQAFDEGAGGVGWGEWAAGRVVRWSCLLVSGSECQHGHLAAGECCMARPTAYQAGCLLRCASGSARAQPALPARPPPIWRSRDPALMHSDDFVGIV